MAGLLPKKVSDESILEMRERAANGESDESIAARFGVHPGYVKTVRAGRARKRAGGALTARALTPAALARRVAGLERAVAQLEKSLQRGKRALVVASILERLERGETLDAIASLENCSLSFVGRVVRAHYTEIDARERLAGTDTIDGTT